MDLRAILNNLNNIPIAALKEKMDALIELYNEAQLRVIEEANDFAEFAIEKYYLYPTKKYIRHFQTSPGTMTGENLYNAFDPTINEFTYKGFEILAMDDFVPEPEKLEDYKSKISKEEILDIILNGKRIIGKGRGRIPDFIDWKFAYKGVIFSSPESETLKEAMERFNKEMPEMIDNLFEKKCESRFNEIDNKYNKKISYLSNELILKLMEVI